MTQRTPSTTARALLGLLLTPTAAFACGGYGDFLPEGAPPPERGGQPPTLEIGDRAPAEEASAPRPVDLVICLDSSGSMNGLIDACRQKLWDVASQLAQARPAPRLRVALISFGSDRGGQDGFVVIESPFTAELDQVYERLFALQASGSTELVGRAIHHGLTGLAWSDDPRALKMMMIAGNESADQDTEFRVHEQVGAALQQSVVVNAIYCGADGQAGAPDGDAATWREVARLGGGEYAAIDQEGTVAVATPFDAEIAALGREINATYLAFGARGRAMAENQVAQDANAEHCGDATLASRMQLKGKAGLYRNSSWDLVDARAEEGFDWSKLKDEELPEVLRGKSVAERELYVKHLAAERAAIQAKINALGQKRTAFIAAALKERAAEHGKSFDFAIAKAVRKAAEAKGFSFE